MNHEADPISLEIERAATLIDLRRFEEAASSLHRLLGHDPDNGRGWCLLAQAQLSRDDSESALEAANRAVAVEPEFEWGHRLRSTALRETGDDRGAIAAAFEAVRLAPDEWQGYACLSRALAEVESRRDEAVAAAEHAVALAPTRSEAHLAAGDAFAGAGNREEADAAYRRALALDPQNAAAHNNLARVNMRTGRTRFLGLGDAAAGFETAVRADPHGSVSTYNLEVTLRSFLAWLSYLIFIVAFVYWWIPARPLVIGVLLCVPAVFALRFVSRIGSGLRGHLFHSVTHGRLGVAAALQLVAVLVMIYGVAASLPSHGVTAGVALALTVISRFILQFEIAGFTGSTHLSKRLLRRIALALGLIGLVFAIAATSEPTGGKTALDALVSGACLVGLIYAVRSSRRD
jgi:tetratricopeptide (TPR) repeat protein